MDACRRRGTAIRAEAADLARPANCSTDIHQGCEPAGRRHRRRPNRGQDGPRSVARCRASAGSRARGVSGRARRGHVSRRRLLPSRASSGASLRRRGSCRRRRLRRSRARGHGASSAWWRAARRPVQRATSAGSSAASTTASGRGRASSALRRPVRAISIACLSGIWRARRCRPPWAARPTRGSGSPKRAWRAAIARSQASTSSRPPPMASPLPPRSPACPGRSAR